MIEDYSASYKNVCIDMFLDIFSNTPFNYKWLNYNNILRYFTDLENTPNFKGFIYFLDNQPVAFCLGVISDYFNTPKYHINEIFVKRQLQNSGIGSDMLDKIQSELFSYDISVIELSTSISKPAFNFYLNNGFVKSNDTVYMIKPLIR